MWTLFGLYLVYYILLPLGFIFLVWKLWQKKDTLKGISDFGSKEKSIPDVKKGIGEMERIQVFIIIFILLFIPASNFISFQIQDLTIEYNRVPTGGLGGSIEYPQVRRQLGPSYDTDYIISQMDTYLFSLDRLDYELEEGPVSEELRQEFDKRGYVLREGWNLTEEDDVWWIITDDEEKKFRIEENADELDVYEKPPAHRTWFIEDVREAVDLESLTRFPGRLTVYHLDKRRAGQFLVITYNYFSPIPITRAFVFLVLEDEASLYEEKTIVYPSNPSNIDPF